MRSSIVTTTLTVVSLVGIVLLFERSHRVRLEPRPRISSTGSDILIKQAVHAPVVQNRFDWRELESSDYREYIRRLRGVGCPEQTIRDIIVAELNTLFDRREKAARATNQVRFWQTSGRMLTDLYKSSLMDLHRRFEAERVAVLRELLGDKVSIEPRPFEISDLELKTAMLDFLPEERRASAAMSIMQTEAPFTSQFFPKLKVGNWNDDDRKAYGKYCQDRDAELLSLLGPTGKEEYDIRFSNLSGKLRFLMSGISMSEDEFRQIYDFAAQYQMIMDPYFSNTRDPIQNQEFVQAQDAIWQDVRNVVGDSRVDGRTLTQWEIDHGMGPGRR